MTPLFSILHTSARPEKWREIYDAWLGSAVNRDQVEYVLCVDERWGFTPSMFLSDTVRPQDRIVWNKGRRCYVDGVNTAAKASTGRILIVNADDQFPCGRWDEQLQASIGLCIDSECFHNKGTNAEPHSHASDKPGALLWQDFVIEVSTGTPQEHDRAILVMPILSRARYERLGYVFYPEYESMFADNDFCEHARQDGVIVDARHLLFPHRHPGIDSGTGTWKKQVQVDQQLMEQNRPEAYQVGGQVLAYRRHIRFGDVISEADKIQGWMNRGELEWLSRAAYESRSVIEVGSWKGRSAYALAKSCKGSVHCVDTWEGSPELPEMQFEAANDAVFQEFQKHTAGLGIVRHRGDSAQMAKECPTVGMVFLDGGHTYAQVKADLLAYMTKATKLICGHDFPAPEVRQAVGEILGDVQIVPGTRLWYYRLPENCQFEVKSKPEHQTIALCLSGEMFHWEWVSALLVLHTHLGSRGFQVWTAREYTSNVYVTREQIRKVMMQQEPKPDLFLWIDDDNPPPSPQQFDLLMEDLNAHPDVDGVTGWCYIYNTDKGSFYPSCGTWSPDGLRWRPFDSIFFPHETEPRPVEATGFPCFLMRRSALEKAGDRPFLPIMDETLDQGVTGEDFSFCHKAQDNGAKFLVDPRVRVRHLKVSDAVPNVPHPQQLTEPIVAVMMRVKNESRWIERCISSVIPLAGENVFVMDDESTDDTLEIARALGVTVYSDPFAGQALDETRDKEWLLTKVKDACDPDWILCIDGDEELEPDGAEMIRRLLATNPDVDVFALNFLFLWDSVDQIRVDGRYSSLGRESLFRAKTGIHFKSYYETRNEADPKCHVGLHCGNAPVSTGRKSPINVNLLHYGYIFREDRIRKYNWYRSIDPDNPHEDNYRHMVLGDLPEFPVDLKLAFGGPLKLVKLTKRMIPQFEKAPKPLQEEVTA